MATGPILSCVGLSKTTSAIIATLLAIRTFFRKPTIKRRNPSQNLFREWIRWLSCFSISA